MNKHTTYSTLFASIVSVFAAPSVSQAAVTIGDIIDAFSMSLSRFVIVGLGFAMVVFVWGVVLFIQKSGDDEGVKGRSRMLWGIAGLFFIVTVWGVVSVLQEIFGIDPEQTKCKSPSVALEGGRYVMTTCDD